MNIYLGNLNYGVKEQDLQSLLAGFGEIDTVKIVVDRESGRSKGFGFAEMPDSRAARRAIEALAGTQFAGRTLVIKEALPRVWPRKKHCIIFNYNKFFRSATDKRLRFFLWEESYPKSLL